MKTMTELVSWFQLEYPQLVQDMKLSNHHLTKGEAARLEMLKEGMSRISGGTMMYPESLNPYHIESDVFTHTMMVCKQAENASYEVRIAALLHDIGKPSTRKVNPKNGRVSFFNHDAVSAFMALEIMNHLYLELTDDQKSHIFNLIALHTQIYKLTNKQLSEIGDVELVTNLIELGKADHGGRFHTAGEAVIPTIEEVFPELMSGVSSVKRSAQEKEVIVLVGLPNGGKSTYRNGKDSFIVSRDDCILAEAMLRDTIPYNESDYNNLWDKADQKNVDRLLQDRFKESKKWNNVIVDMTHMSKKSRRRSLSYYDSDYKKTCVVFLPDLLSICERNSKRKGKVIDNDIIQKMIRSFYPPTNAEFDEIVYIL